MKTIDIINAIILTIFISAAILCIIASISDSYSKNLACENLGYTSLHSANGFSINTCEDAEGNLHYVKLDCQGFPFVKCTAKNIKVGDVTGVLK